MVKTLAIFDFDGTLFRSPVPNPKLWNRSVLGLLYSAPSSGGLGWFQSTLTLSPPYIPSPPPLGFFNSEIFEAAQRSICDPNSVSVLLTGRTVEYKDIITGLLTHYGLVFDHYGFKGLNGDTTKDFKEGFVRDIVSKTNPDLIQLFEDRIGHVKFFHSLLSSLNIKYEIIHVQESNIQLKKKLEQDLVQRLIQKRNENFPSNQISTQKKILFSGIKLTKSSHEELLEKFPPPTGWKPVAHHLTLNTGNLNVEKTRLTVGQEVEFRITHVSKNEKAMAVLAHPEDKFDINGPKLPHITIAHSLIGHPKDSNFLKIWEPVNQTIIRGKVKEWGGYDLVQSHPPEKEKKKSSDRVTIVDLMRKTYPELSKISEKNLVPGIIMVAMQMKEKNVKLSKENEAAIVELISSLDSESFYAKRD
eukprot:TRINITY_DN15871_c0_g1_i1.p1 TRINITY_DN15871_c0_g1~~TRINITY_DN15871_c0_g1_i1.p1  ORF type:complete len:416 (+),score=79.80 TRINITY_DN15871_c0_g1_i1:33-1280(+)